MIDTQYKDDTLRALAFVFQSANQFQVCGSRYFGDVKSTSDYDFVTNADFVGMDYLLENGWKYSNSDRGGYLDCNTLHVIQCGKVQIIIVYSIERRLKARAYILEHGLDRNKTESWEAAYDVIPK